MFITFEGGEGCGKSTQARLLRDYLSSIGKEVVLTREPGGTKFAERLREVLLSGSGISDPLTEFLLISAARRDHVINHISPSSKASKVVISDRFIDSSFVYQGYVKGLSFDLIEQLTKISIGEFTPDITILLDIDPKLSITRVKESRGVENYYDKQSIDFHSKIREGFLQLAQKFDQRIKVVDASGSQEVIFQKVKSIISKKTSSYFSNNKLKQ